MFVCLFGLGFNAKTMCTQIKDCGGMKMIDHLCKLFEFADSSFQELLCASQEHRSRTPVHSRLDPYSLHLVTSILQNPQLE